MVLAKISATAIIKILDHIIPVLPMSDFRGLSLIGPTLSMED